VSAGDNELKTEMDLSGFDEKLAASLTATIVQRAYTGAREWMRGDSEANALSRCIEAAIAAAIQYLQPRDVLTSADLSAEIGYILSSIFEKTAASDALISAALEGKGDAAKLIQLAGEAGLDSSTLPFRWEEFIVVLLAELEKAIYQETKSPGSKLRQRVGLSELFRLRCSVALLTESIERVVDRMSSGLAELASDARFRDFCVEYLGLSDRPKPFGGRLHEIEILNEWVRESGIARKLLLVAPAGRGKSALLVHWLRQLPSDVEQVFIPISLRHRSALPETFIPALVNELARKYGVKLQPEDLRNLDNSRAVVASLLSKPLPNGRTLVVVMDGLDEAGDQYSCAASP
jgi:hypothetical protein